MSRTIEKHSLPPSVSQDIALIRSELDHCRQILDRLASAAVMPPGKRLTQTTVDEFFERYCWAFVNQAVCALSVAITSSRLLATCLCKRQLKLFAISCRTPSMPVNLGGCRAESRSGRRQVAAAGGRSRRWYDQRSVATHRSTILHHQGTRSRHGAWSVSHAKRTSSIRRQIGFLESTRSWHDCRSHLAVQTSLASSTIRRWCN